MIVKDITKLNQPCVWVGSLEEGEDIAVKLFRELITSKNAIGLAANQIGIDKRVCVINVKEPLSFVNPRIVEKSDDTFLSLESCLSFPNKHVRIKRYSEIIVEADNLRNRVMFTANTDNDRDKLECACIQHEIAHLDGLTMFDFEYKPEPIVNSDKNYSRNQKVTISNGKETKIIKYKKAERLLELDWELVEEA